MIAETGNRREDIAAHETRVADMAQLIESRGWKILLRQMEVERESCIVAMRNATTTDMIAKAAQSMLVFDAIIKMPEAELESSSARLKAMAQEAVALDAYLQPSPHRRKP